MKKLVSEERKRQRDYQIKIVKEARRQGIITGLAIGVPLGAIIIDLAYTTLL